MALHQDDMSQVPDFGEIVPERLDYHVRVSKVEEKDSSEGNPMVVFSLKIQNDGEVFGRSITIFASLLSTALGTLKRVYKAAGYQPGPEGHDPEQVLDAEFYVGVKHGKNPKNGETVPNVPLWSIRSLSEGPARAQHK